MKDEPAIIIRLTGNGRIYCPGEKLTGEYSFEELSPDEIKALEVSVLWFTEGKGDVDMAVHQFWRTGLENGDAVKLQLPARFETVLPNSPLSYDGQIVKIRWCVRVRAFLHRGGKEIFTQKEFRLGNVPPTTILAKTSPLPLGEGQG
jgi:hypothetical protein